MTHVMYGVWNGEVLDNRGKAPHEVDPIDDLQGFETFNEGNPIKAFLGDRGFYVFDEKTSLVDALRQYMAKVADESCGKCTPCRMGSVLIHESLTALAEGRFDEVDLDEMKMLSDQMVETSLCGLGQTGGVALSAALDHFRDKLETESHNGPAVNQNCMSYVTTPCIEACPSQVNVPRYIDYIKEGLPSHSLGVVLQKYPMAATCGRVCVRHCEMACRRNLVDDAVGIKTLKRYVADQQKGPKADLFSKDMIAKSQPEDMRVAIIGAGPSGISCAYHLLLKGFHVDLFEAQEQAGGMASIGIPSYRLPKDVLQSEIDIIERLGGKIHYNQALGRDFSVNDLFEKGFKSVYIAVGCAEGTQMGVEDEDPSIEGYYAGIDFLLKVHDHVSGENVMHINGEVVVVGGGNVAMDCARSALRMGATKVHVVYRRTKEDMPADHVEIEAAEEEGIVFHFLTNPTKIIHENGALKGIEVIDMRQKDADTGDRRRRGVEPVSGTERFFACKVVIPAIGQRIRSGSFSAADQIEMDRWKCVDADKNTLQTSRPGVFAGGDCNTGPSTLISAMAEGLRGARSIADYLTLGRLRFFPRTRMREILNQHSMLASDCIEVPVKGQYRVHHPELDPNVRKRMFGEVEKTITKEEAYEEAKRCLRCFRVYSVITEMPIPDADA
ncbi:MAG: FAD-dependent oxidoreductase [Alphaproteobacteria bacterium]